MNYTKFSQLLLVLLVSAMPFSSSSAQSKNTVENLIPKPLSVTTREGMFLITTETAIYIEGDTTKIMPVAQSLADKLKPATGFDIPIWTFKGERKAGNIYLTVTGNDTALGDEGYELSISKEYAKITANKSAGLFYAI